MPLNDFLDLIESNLSVGQRQLLGRFLADVEAGRVPGDAAELRALLDQAGQLLPFPDGDVARPEGYNQAVRTLLANIAGLYQDLDRLDSVHDALSELARAELDKIDLALRDISAILNQARTVNTAAFQYTDVWFESFGPGTDYEKDPSWYKPIPALAEQGYVESYLPAYIDPTDRSLKLFPGGDFSRSISPHGEPLVQARVEELLGLSIDQTHRLEQAIDGKVTSYWREMVLSEAPIQADTLQVPWLPSTYPGGAAVRLHFRFPFTVPFTEIQLRPFSRYPVHALQVVWDNRKDRADTKLTNGDFADGATGWTVTKPVGVTHAFYLAGGHNNGPHFATDPNGGRVLLASAAFDLARGEQFYHLHLKLWRPDEVQFRVLVEWFNTAGDKLRADWVDCEGPAEDWFEFSRLFQTPDALFDAATDVAPAQAKLTLMVDGDGAAQAAELVFSPARGDNMDQAPDPETNVLNLQLAGAVGTDVWITLAQPHYEFLQLALPEGELASQALWDELQLQAQARADAVYRPERTPWSLEDGHRTAPEVSLPDNGTLLVQEAKKFGGRIRNLVAELMQHVHPDPTPRHLNRFLYVLGAWEIQIRHREYAPQGLWVSTPYQPRGECRELLLSTDPPLSELEGNVRFWVVPRAQDGADKAKLMVGRVTFSCTDEEAAHRGHVHFELPALRRSETFEGTDRNGYVVLEHHPYINRERIWAIQNAVNRGRVKWPLRFDPNKTEYHHYLVGKPWDRVFGLPVTLTQVAGYRPLEVQLELADGTIVEPDALGPVQRGDIGYAGQELLDLAISTEDDYSSANDPDADDDVDPDAAPAPSPRPRKRRGKRKPARRRQRRQKNKKVRRFETTVQTRFKNIVASLTGAALSLYWHRTADDTDEAMVNTADQLIPSQAYKVDAKNGVITVKASRPSQAYDSFVCYYHYWRDEENGREEFDSAREDAPTSGVDQAGQSSQVYPVTRNVTDYVQGQKRKLRPAVLNELDGDYYPVFEYMVDSRGRILFANNLHPFGEFPATVRVKYQTLALAPRILVEFPRQSLAGFSSYSPVLHDMTVMMNARK